MKAETQQKMAQAMASGFGMPLEIALQPGTTLVEGEKKKADSWNTLFPVGEQVRLVLAPDLIQPVKDVLAALPAGHRLTVDDVHRHALARQLPGDGQADYSAANNDHIVHLTTPLSSAIFVLPQFSASGVAYGLCQFVRTGPVDRLTGLVDIASIEQHF